MNVSLDSILNFAGMIVAAVVAWLTAQWAKLRSEQREAERTLSAYGTRVAVLESRLDSMPKTLEDIKGEIVGLRKDVSESMERLHARVDTKADR